MRTFGSGHPHEKFAATWQYVFQLDNAPRARERRTQSVAAGRRRRWPPGTTVCFLFDYLRFVTMTICGLLPDSAAIIYLDPGGTADVCCEAPRAALSAVPMLVPQSPSSTFVWSVVAVMRRVSEATGVRTGHVRKQASQAYAEEGLT